MNQRRSLSQALQTAELPPEALAIIKEGGVRPMQERPAAPRKVEPEVRGPAVQGASPREGGRTEVETESHTPRGLVPLSVRVQASLADTLLKVAFDRKLQRKHPFSQQDIVIQAVNQWLRKNGYPVDER